MPARLDLVEQPLRHSPRGRVLRKQVDRQPQAPAAALPSARRRAAPCAGPAATAVRRGPPPRPARTAARRSTARSPSAPAPRRRRLRPSPRLDLRLKENLDLLVRDRAFEQQVARRERRAPMLPDPTPACPTRTLFPSSCMTTCANVRLTAPEAPVPAATRNGTVTRRAAIPMFTAVGQPRSGGLNADAPNATRATGSDSICARLESASLVLAHRSRARRPEALLRRRYDLRRCRGSRDPGRARRRRLHAADAARACSKAGARSRSSA